MQHEFQVTYFANNNAWRYLYCSCIFKAWQLLNGNSFYNLITHQLNIMQSPSVKGWIYNNNVAKGKNELTKLKNGITIMKTAIS